MAALDLLRIGDAGNIESGAENKVSESRKIIYGPRIETISRIRRCVEESQPTVLSAVSAPTARTPGDCTGSGGRGSRCRRDRPRRMPQ